VSDSPERRRRDFAERLRYLLGEERWLQFVEMAESGELEKHRQAFFETIERDELERCVKQFEFRREFPGAFN
jgi:hypothetical protein